MAIWQLFIASVYNTRLASLITRALRANNKNNTVATTVRRYYTLYIALVFNFRVTQLKFYII